MEESIKMRKHVKNVAVIQIVRSSLWLIIAILSAIGLGIAMGVVDDEMAMRVLKIVLITFPVFLGLFAILGLTAGIALLTFKAWGRIMTLIITGMGCLVIPIGTLIGVYSIWVLMQDETIKLFDTVKPEKVL
jgi:hypothetical protein